MRTVARGLALAGVLIAGHPQASLAQADLTRAGLAQADLAQADLAQADLAQADLAQANQDAVKRGRELARLVCAACHVVSDDPGRTPILRTPGPSFAAIAARDTTTADTLRSLLATDHATMGPAGRMPNPRLVDYQIDELVAYILSLRHRS